MMREFCQNLAQKRLDTENNIDAGIQDKAEREYVEPVTGAKLTYDFSLMVLAHFVGSLVTIPPAIIKYEANSLSRMRMVMTSQSII